MQLGKRLYDGITESPSEYDKEDELMALKNLANWNLSPSAACGASCGASDKPAEEEKKPAACGAACGAADKPAEEQPAACGAADKPAEEKPAACGVACGTFRRTMKQDALSYSVTVTGPIRRRNQGKLDEARS